MRYFHAYPNETLLNPPIQIEAVDFAVSVRLAEQHLRTYFTNLATKKPTNGDIVLQEVNMAKVYSQCPDLNPGRVENIAIECGLNVILTKDEAQQGMVNVILKDTLANKICSGLEVIKTAAGKSGFRNLKIITLPAKNVQEGDFIETKIGFMKVLKKATDKIDETTAAIIILQLQTGKLNLTEEEAVNVLRQEGAPLGAKTTPSYEPA